MRNGEAKNECRETGSAKANSRLEVGLARLDFRNGATVTLQGPAEFEILSTDKCNPEQWNPHGVHTESAVGFEVLTPAMDVVDLGTAFGVSVGADGETDVCVFEGEVEVSLSDGADDASACPRRQCRPVQTESRHDRFRGLLDRAL